MEVFYYSCMKSSKKQATSQLDSSYSCSPVPEHQALAGVLKLQSCLTQLFTQLPKPGIMGPTPGASQGGATEERKGLVKFGRDRKTAILPVFRDLYFRATPFNLDRCFSSGPSVSMWCFEFSDSETFSLFSFQMRRRPLGLSSERAKREPTRISSIGKAERTPSLKKRINSSASPTPTQSHTEHLIVPASFLLRPPTCRARKKPSSYLHQTPSCILNTNPITCHRYNGLLQNMAGAVGHALCVSAIPTARPSKYRMETFFFTLGT